MVYYIVDIYYELKTDSITETTLRAFGEKKNKSKLKQRRTFANFCES